MNNNNDNNKTRGGGLGNTTVYTMSEVIRLTVLLRIHKGLYVVRKYDYHYVQNITCMAMFIVASEFMGSVIV